MRPGPQSFVVGAKANPVHVTVDAEGRIEYGGDLFCAISGFALELVRQRNPQRRSCDGWQEVWWNGQRLATYRNELRKAEQAGTQQGQATTHAPPERALRSWKGGPAPAACFSQGPQQQENAGLPPAYVLSQYQQHQQLLSTAWPVVPLVAQDSPLLLLAEAAVAAAAQSPAAEAAAAAAAAGAVAEAEAAPAAAAAAVLAPRSRLVVADWSPVNLGPAPALPAAPAGWQRDLRGVAQRDRREPRMQLVP
eukprot:scaffold13.g288.t1